VSPCKGLTNKIDLGSSPSFYVDVGPGPGQSARAKRTLVCTRIMFAIMSSLPDLPEQPHHPLDLSFKFPKRVYGKKNTVFCSVLSGDGLQSISAPAEDVELIESTFFGLERFHTGPVHS